MGCLLVLLGAFFPRIAVLLIWLARPIRFSDAFNGLLIWPILGVIFLPFTTLMYVLLWSPGVTLSGVDWIFVALAFLLDIGVLGGTGYTNRDRMWVRRQY